MSREARIEALARVIATVHTLRAPGGCPWDREQTHQSIRQYLIEEAYEVLELLDQVPTSATLLADDTLRASLREELGDLLMQVLLHAEIAAEAGAFDIYDIAATLDEKLVRRHPHVFGEHKAENAAVAYQRWERVKAKEKEQRASDPSEASVLDGLPKGMPALQLAGRTLEKVTNVGFQWDDMHGPLAKVREEVAELEHEVLAFERLHPTRKGPMPAEAAAVKDKVEAELGDVLFTLCNVAFLTQINPEDALRRTLKRFQGRFRHVEKRLREQGKTPEESTLEEMDVHWDEAKRLEREKA